MDLGPELLLAIRPFGALERAEGAIARHPRRMDDTMELTEAREGDLDQRSGRPRLGDVGAHHQDLGAGCLELAQSMDPDAHRIVVAMSFQPGVPFLGGGKRRAPGEHQPGASRGREMAGEEQADLAKAAGDDVHTTFAQARERRLRGLQRQRLEGFQPTVRAAQGDHRIADL